MRLYLKQASKGHTPKVEEPDILHAFKIKKRTEKFSLSLKDLNAHTMKIIEIIEEQQGRIEAENVREMEAKINNAGRS